LGTDLAAEEKYQNQCHRDHNCRFHFFPHI
jgi:hypothetical protein